MKYKKPSFLFYIVLVFLFQLVNKKTFELKILKMNYFTFLAIFYLKMNVCQNLNLSHTYDHHLENMITIKFFIWFTNLFHSYGITILNRYYKIHKNQRIFQSFLEYIYFLICWDVHLFT
jgi:hypothetical protein